MNGGLSLRSNGPDQNTYQHELIWAIDSNREMDEPGIMLWTDYRWVPLLARSTCAKNTQSKRRRRRIRSNPIDRVSSFVSIISSGSPPSKPTQKKMEIASMVGKPKKAGLSTALNDTDRKTHFAEGRVRRFCSNSNQRTETKKWSLKPGNGETSWESQKLKRGGKNWRWTNSSPALWWQIEIYHLGTFQF